MKVLGRSSIEEFKSGHAASREPLDRWVVAAQNSSPKHFIDLKRTFGSADLVFPYTVFNVKGNQIRIIARVSYSLQVITITQVLTHGEYDEGGWRK